MGRRFWVAVARAFLCAFVPVAGMCIFAFWERPAAIVLGIAGAAVFALIATAPGIAIGATAAPACHPPNVRLAAWRGVMGGDTGGRHARGGSGTDRGDSGLLGRA